MTPAPVPAPSRPAFGGRRPLLGGLLWAGGAVAGWVVGRRAGWSAGELVIAGSVWVLLLLVVARQFLRDLFGPVFVYEVVRVGRRPSTFILRWVYVGAILALLGLLYFSWSYSMEQKGYRGNVPPVRLAEFATLYFEYVAVIQLAAVVLLTPGYVAGTISNEKERQTLEFLLATDLKNREIVFGKLAARTITLGMYVLAGLPVLAFLQLFGGIDPDLVLASAAAAVLTVVGLSALSLAFSAAFKKSRDAIAVTYLVVIGYLAVSFTLAIVVREVLVRQGRNLTDFGLFVVDWQVVAEWFAAGNAAYVYPTETRGRQVDGDLIARMLGRYAAFWGVVALLALLYAVTRLRAVALRQSYGTPRTAPARIAAARPGMGTRPVLWREVFGSSGRLGVGGWLFRIVVVGLVATVPTIGAYMIFFDGSSRRWHPTFASRWAEFVRSISMWVRVTTGVLTTVILFGVALRGAAAVAGERDKDTWLSLISAPLAPAEVLFGKWLGCVMTMRFAYGVLLGVWAVGLAFQAVNFGMLLVTVGLVALYAAAFSWVGILCSLTAKTTLGASLRAFAATAFLGGGFWLLFLLCCVLPMGISGGGSRQTLDIPTVLLLGGTPPFVAGWAPMMKLDRDEMGPFHPNEISGVGPVGPVVGTAVWVGLTVLFAAFALRLMAKAMNRQEKPDPFWRKPAAPRPRATRAE